MTPTTTRPARGQAQESIRHASLSLRRVAHNHGIGRARRAAVLSRGAAPMFSLLLPSYCHANPTEEAMPDPDAGPSHRPGAHPRRHVLN